jgi:hypothetical protein
MPAAQNWSALTPAIRLPVEGATVRTFEDHYADAREA